MSRTIDDEEKASLLFVCLGNICRSPLAEGVCRSLVKERSREFHIDSCGTGSWHTGEPPDPRSVEIALKHGIDLSSLRARKLNPSTDYAQFDYIVCMDQSNYRDVLARAPPTYTAQIVEFVSFLPSSYSHSGGVPDPYYEGTEGFQVVWDMLTAGMSRLLEEI